MMETMTDEYVDYMADSGSSADQIVAGFHAIDERVNAMRCLLYTSDAADD